jgi:hypothetical protein
LQKIVLKEYFGRMFWENVLEKYFGRIFWKNILREYFERMFWEDILEKHFGRMFWKDVLRGSGNNLPDLLYISNKPSNTIGPRGLGGTPTPQRRQRILASWHHNTKTLRS